MKWAGRKTGGCISRREKAGRDRLWVFRGKVEKDWARLFMLQSRCRRKESDKNKNLLCRGSLQFHNVFCLQALQRQVHETLVPSHEYSHSLHAPDDFTPNCKMNSFTDYMSNTFCSSSVCNLQMEPSANTHVFAYPPTQGLFKMEILLLC